MKLDEILMEVGRDEEKNNGKGEDVAGHPRGMGEDGFTCSPFLAPFMYFWWLGLLGFDLGKD